MTKAYLVLSVAELKGLLNKAKRHSKARYGKIKPHDCIVLRELEIVEGHNNSEGELQISSCSVRKNYE